MRLEKDINMIGQIAAEKEEENDVFRDFLLTCDSHEIDKTVQDLYGSIAPEIDCTQCGNCCRSLMINVNDKDITRLSAHLQIDSKEAKNKYIEQGIGEECIIKQIPCFFLDINKCTVYESRFNSCRDFPHLDKDGFTLRLFSIMMNYRICPIIFNVVETLKKEVCFN